MSTKFHFESEKKKMAEKLAHRPQLAALYANCFPNTAETTFQRLEDNTSFVITGDIPAMWLRDSSAQVHHYLNICPENAEMTEAIEGLIRRQAMYINIDGYANAFNQKANGHGHQDDQTQTGPWIWERKYEIDSLCYPVWLAYLFWKKTGRTGQFDEEFHKAMQTILHIWKTEQNHDENSPYSFTRLNCPETDTLPREGRGAPVAYTGMTWSGFRPSDDACTYGYLVPANFFAASVLGYMQEIAREMYHDEPLAAEARKLQKEIRSGLEKYATVEHPHFGKMYAYETDGKGNRLLMDDANVPSLLSLPYLGCCTADDPVYKNTRAFLLSDENPTFYKGKTACGIGSPHTPANHVWPISLIVQGLTSNDKNEIESILDTLEKTHADTGYMHESFHVDDPANFTRAWFAWANSIFCELVEKYAEM